MFNTLMDHMWDLSAMASQNMTSAQVHKALGLVHTRCSGDCIGRLFQWSATTWTRKYASVRLVHSTAVVCGHSVRRKKYCMKLNCLNDINKVQETVTHQAQNRCAQLDHTAHQLHHCNGVAAVNKPLMFWGGHAQSCKFIQTCLWDWIKSVPPVRNII